MKVLYAFLLVLILGNVHAQAPRLVPPAKHGGSPDNTYMDPNGKFRVTTGFKDKTALIWDMRTGYLLAALEDTMAHRGFEDVFFPNNGKQVGTVSTGGLKIWDIASQRCLFTLDIGEDEEYGGYNYSSELANVAVCLGNSVKIIDLTQLKVIKEIKTGSEIRGAVFTKGNALLLISDKDLRFLSTRSWASLPVRFPRDADSDIALSEDLGLIAFRSDSSLVAANLATYDFKLKVPFGSILSLRFLPPQRLLVSDPSSIYLYNLASGEMVYKKPYSRIVSSTISADGRHAIIGSASLQEYLIRTDNGELVFSSLKEEQLFFSDDQKSVSRVTSFEDSDSSKVTLIDLETGKVLSSHMEIIKEEEETGNTNGLNFTAGLLANFAGTRLVSTGDALSIWNTATGQLIATSATNNADAYIEASLSENGQYVISTKSLFDPDKVEIEVWNIISGLQVFKHTLDSGYVSETALSYDGKLAAFITEDDNGATLHAFDILSGKSQQVRLGDSAPDVLLISPDKRFILLSSEEGIEVRFLNDLTHPKKLEGSIARAYPQVFSPDGKTLVSGGDKIILWDTQTLNLKKSINTSAGSVFFSPDGQRLVTDQEILTVNSPAKIVFLEISEDDISGYPGRSDPPRFNSNGTLAYRIERDSGSGGDNAYIQIWDAGTGKKVFTSKDNVIERGFISQNGRIFLESEWEPYTLRFIDTRTKRAAALPNEVGRILDAAFIHSDSVAFTTYGNLKRWDTSTGKLVSTSYSIDSTGYLSQIPTGYYMASPDAAKKLHYVTNDLKIITFEQLDIKYNRPDRVLEYIGNRDTALIHSYKRAYEKRIQKLGIDTNSFKSGYNVPDADFQNRDMLQFEQKRKQLALHVKASDGIYTLDRFNIWINDVPVFGIKGIDLKARNSQKLDTTLVVNLSQGSNKIETSVINSNGTESLRMPLLLNYQPEEKYKPKMYFIGMGINRFRETGHQLQWSVKDIRDLTEGLKKKHGADFIVLDTLFDQDLTVDKVLALKQKLAGINEDDKLIISYSGHGLLSRNYDYYLSTYDVIFSDPKQNGLAYDALEDIMDNSRSRNKLILIDACHSGEIDKDELAMLAQTRQQRKNQNTLDIPDGVKGTPGVNLSQNVRLGMKGSFELMRDLFVNVSRGTGSTVISAAGGMQYAQEQTVLRNGVFTYSILELMQQKNNVGINELKNYVFSRVSKLTAGAQQPTSRTGDTSVNWIVW